MWLILFLLAAYVIAAVGFWESLEGPLKEEHPELTKVATVLWLPFMIGFLLVYGIQTLFKKTELKK